MIVTLLDLTTRKNQIKKKIRELQGGSVVYSPEIITLAKELDETQAAIDTWGRQSNAVYRIC